jgi:hypothetical protein
MDVEKDGHVVVMFNRIQPRDLALAEVDTAKLGLNYKNFLRIRDPDIEKLIKCELDRAKLMEE